MITRKHNFKRGMTYVELIVVLSIFAMMSGVIMFNYGAFQAKVDIKNLASQIALKIVEAQKSSLSGKLPPSTITTFDDWKPAYGVYFDLGTDPKSFIYFTDLHGANGGLIQNGQFDDSFDCIGSECLDKIVIEKGESISSLDAVLNDNSTFSLDNLTVSFSRPSSSALLFNSGFSISDVSYVQITITSPKGATAYIKVYASGRIQVN